MCQIPGKFGQSNKLSVLGFNFGQDRFTVHYQWGGEEKTSQFSILNLYLLVYSVLNSIHSVFSCNEDLFKSTVITCEMIHCDEVTQNFP